MLSYSFIYIGETFFVFFHFVDTCIYSGYFYKIKFNNEWWWILRKSQWTLLAIVFFPSKSKCSTIFTDKLILNNKYHVFDWYFCIQNNGLKKNYESDIIFQDNIHNILALSFLKPNQVIHGFEYLCGDISNEYQLVLDYMKDNYKRRLRRCSQRAATFPIDFWNIEAATRATKSVIERTTIQFSSCAQAVQQ